jgi:hypothetical protein
MCKGSRKAPTSKANNPNHIPASSDMADSAEAVDDAEAEYGALMTSSCDKTKQETAFPFVLPPSNSAVQRLPRGWIRRAVTSSKGLSIQATIQKDSKVFCLLASAAIGPATEEITRRQGSGKISKFPTTPAHAQYLKFFGGVDRADRGISDYTVSRRTKRWYNR